LPQDISMRWSRIALSPWRTPVIIRTLPSKSASARERACIGSILICRVHQRSVLLFGGGTPRPRM
jgi:hypothetical protein